MGGFSVSVKAAGGDRHTAVISVVVLPSAKHIKKRREDIERQKKGKELIESQKIVVGRD